MPILVTLHYVLKLIFCSLRDKVVKFRVFCKVDDDALSYYLAYCKSKKNSP